MNSICSKLRYVVFLFYYGLVFCAGLGPAEVMGYQLPDTGQTKCYDDYGNVINCPKPGEPLNGQDAQFPGAQPRYQDKGNGTVTDVNTGLTWQQDGQFYGTYQDARYLCEVLLNILEFGEYHDWRIPNRRELLSIVDYGRSSPSINTNYFPDTPLSVFWSSTLRLPFQQTKEFRWTVNFEGGIPLFSRSDVFSDSQNYIRCARGNPLPEGKSAEFTNNGDGTVTDKATKLVWQKSYFFDSPDWRDAMAYCENLNLAGANDWRLPNIRELESIVFPNRYSPAIDRAFFDCCGGFGSVYSYWSSTTWEEYPNKALTVDFFDGIFNIADRALKNTDDSFVRCVRGGGFRCAGRLATIVGTSGNDTIKGTPSTDVIVGLEGNDNIIGNGGNDVICGGSGKDLIYGNDGNDKLYGGNGNDKLYGGSGKDALNGQIGTDVCEGGGGSLDTATNCEIIRSIP